MALEPIVSSGPTITVSTAEELKDAYTLLSHQDGGGTILMEGGEYGTLWIYDYGGTDGDQPVVISSADPSDPAMFDRIHIRAASNIRIENILMDSTGEVRDESVVDLFIQDSTNIQIVDSVFQHDTDNALKDAGEVVERMGQVRTSDNILIEGNLIDGYFHGLAVTDSNMVEVVGNELTNIQGDGFRGGGLQDTLIADNYMHDFYGINWTVTHSDMIQIWGTNNSQITSNLTITGNTLISSDQVSQSIFIRNGDFGKDSSETSGYFENITVTDNLIYNAHYHGITIEDTNGALIDNNTVLWNPDATLDKGDQLGKFYEPVISLKNTLNAAITDNIVADVAVPDGTTVSGNVLVTYSDPGDPNFVGNHFFNPLVGTSVTVEDIYMLATSPWYGTVGSSIGNTPGEVSDGVVAVISSSISPDDQYLVTYDAAGSYDGTGATTDNPGYTYHWSFPDGTTADGLSVTVEYASGGFKGVDLEIRLDGETVAEITRNFSIETKDIFAFDFEDGVVDISDGTPEVVNKGTVVAQGDGNAFLVGDGNKLQIDDGTDGLHGIDSFGLALDLTPTGDETYGIFLHLHQTLTAGITEEGYITFQLLTDESTFDLISRDPIFADGDTHRIGFAFDGSTGHLEIFADGESVSSTEAWGTTVASSYYLTFGNTWQDSMDALIDNVEMSTDPSVAGDLPAEDPPAEDPPAEDPPAEDPPAEDPPAEDPPAEDPPAEDPPAEDPPAEDPPAEDPPAEDPPAEEEDPRGAPREAVASGESGNFLSEILEMFLSIFGLGSKNDLPPANTEEASATSYDTTLADLVPITETLGEDAPGTDDDDEFTDLAA